MLYSVVVVLPTTYENGKQSGKHCYTYTYSHQGQTFVVINSDAFATGSEECMSTFSQEKRALNPVSIVVMEVLV